jgi:hypothetical protein
MSIIGPASDGFVLMQILGFQDHLSRACSALKLKHRPERERSV